jgi:hypothetical protein
VVTQLRHLLPRKPAQPIKHHLHHIAPLKSVNSRACARVRAVVAYDVARGDGPGKVRREVHHLAVP